MGWRACETFSNSSHPSNTMGKKDIIPDMTSYLNEIFPVSLHTAEGGSHVMFDFHVLTFVTDVQQGDAQAQRGSRKGK